MAKALCVLVLIGVATMMGYSQEKASEYVAPSQAVPRGRTPRMQVQWLNPGESTKHTHMVVWSPDGTVQAGHVLTEYVSPTRATASFPGSQEPMGHLVTHENTRCPQCTLQADKAEIALNHREIDEFVAGPPHNCSEHEEYGPFMWSRVIVGGMESSCRC
jgi:hypothetical protein